MPIKIFCRELENLIDKHKILDKINSQNNIELELGCGNRKRISNAIGIDVLDFDCVDIVGDVFDVLNRFPDESVIAVYSYHFFEHISNISKLMNELSRVLKRGAILEIVVPHFSNPYYYSDYTHKSFFGLYTFNYFTQNNFFKRSVPSYDRDKKYKLVNVDLIFKSYPPSYFRHSIKVIIGKIFNSTNYMKEFYEENLCYLFPCYGIKYRLKKL